MTYFHEHEHRHNLRDGTHIVHDHGHHHHGDEPEYSAYEHQFVYTFPGNHHNPKEHEKEDME